MRTPTMFFLLVLIVLGSTYLNGYLYRENLALRSDLDAQETEHAAEMDAMARQMGQLERDNDFLRRELASTPGRQKQGEGAEEGVSGAVYDAPGDNGAFSAEAVPPASDLFPLRALLPFALGAILSTSLFALLCARLGLIRV